MSEQVFTDIFGEEIVLADSVRQMILLKHPETADFIDQLDRIFADPDEIRRSVRDERSVLYYRFEAEILKGKWVVAVVKRIDRNFVSTLYATDQVKSGEVIWKRNT
ncbi:MAG: hypothetical protein K8L91_06560 [Anaerolineae bacterium]|nr:hypothetical protein [Anaerolineae bacterium]